MTFVRLSLDGLVARLTLDHPQGNRINFEMRGQLRDAFKQVAASRVRVLVIQGTGADFCLGGDVRDWAGIPAIDLGPRIEVFAQALENLEQLRIPTIASVQGGCMGGGFELALGCDLIVAAKSAHFAFPEARLGIMTLQGGIIQLAERIGRARALELIMLSQPISAAQMATWNVVNIVTEDINLASEVDKVAARLAQGSTAAFAATKELLRVWRHGGGRTAREALYGLSMPLFDREDVQSAIRNAVDAINAGKPFPDAVFGD
jgi:enoyl-CoA hydratase/carnithine racemase